MLPNVLKTKAFQGQSRAVELRSVARPMGK